jgi:hypothetical protein
MGRIDGGEKVFLDTLQPFLYTRRRFHPGTIYDRRLGHRYHAVILTKTGCVEMRWDGPSMEAGNHSFM